MSILGIFFPPNLRMDILISIWEDLCWPMNETMMGGALRLYTLLTCPCYQQLCFLLSSFFSATLFIRLDAYTDICCCMPFVTEQIWRYAIYVPFRNATASYSNSNWCVKFVCFSYGATKELPIYFPVLLNSTGLGEHIPILFLSCVPKGA
jgi:hypothetical protein